MLKAILAASAITLATAAIGTAAPINGAAVTIGDGVHSSVVDVQSKRDRSRHRSNRHRDRHHHAQRHHNRYHGWHRYSSRPYNWQRRGCVLVGPVWLCP